MKNRVTRLGLMMAGLIILDQVTKYLVRANFEWGESIPIIKGFFNLTYVRNPGAAFGFLAEAHSSIRRPLFLFLPVLACLWLLWLIWTSRSKPLILPLSYTLILTGAIGNLIDRFSFGYVVDFLDFHIKSSHFPAFNVADSCISIAAGLLVLDFLLTLKKNNASHPA
ncbi:MAG: signal peptidase II [Bacteriovoracaceae bacterium]